MGADGGRLLALIVDDEAPARAELRYLLDRTGRVEVVGEAASAREAMALASRLDYDVLFLDIRMPDLTGVDLAHELRSWPRPPAVVFVTAHDDQALQAFSVEAVDYLLKPVSEESLRRAVQRVATLRSGGGSAAPTQTPRVPVADGPDTRLLDPAAIYYCLADGDRTVVGTAEGRVLSPRSLRELEDTLPATTFFRIHRSAMVNLRRVGALEPLGPGRLAVRLTDPASTTLEVARRQTRSLRRALGLAG